MLEIFSTRLLLSAILPSDEDELDEATGSLITLEDIVEGDILTFDAADIDEVCDLLITKDELVVASDIIVELDEPSFENNSDEKP